jgi:hypothetical protein
MATRFEDELELELDQSDTRSSVYVFDRNVQNTLGGALWPSTAGLRC